METPLLSQEYTIPFKTTLSLSNIIGYWQVRTNDPNPVIATHARAIVAEVEAQPELAGDIENLEQLEGKEELIELLLSATIPTALVEDHFVAGVEPFGMKMFYMTHPMRKLLEEAGSLVNMVKNVDVDQIVKIKTVFAYIYILEHFYGEKIEFEQPLITTVTDQESGLSKSFKVEINTRFCQTTLHGELPELSKEDIASIKDNIFDLDQWSKLLPYELFEFKGFALYTLVNVTRQEVLSTIKETLLTPDSLVSIENFYKLEKQLESLLRIRGLKLGIAGFQKNQNNFIDFGKKICKSILTTPGAESICEQGKAELYKSFINTRKPIIIEDVRNSELIGDQYESIVNEGIENILLSPLFYGDDFIGVIELGSPEVKQLNNITITKLEEVLPLFAVAVKRSAEELENRVQAVIKEQYTSIHPVVEWKFIDAAHRYLQKAEAGQTQQPEPIVFDKVYPLYGASDIRNSSTERNKAILSDLKKQLKLAKETLEAAYEWKGLPIIKEINFRLEKQLQKIRRGLITGDEMAILEFLSQDVEPLFKSLSQQNESFAAIASKYFDALDKKYNAIHTARNQFEESLTRINETISTIIDKEEEKAQKMYPHFFEKYKTDGVEYNIYIGDSLTRDDHFDAFYLKNMRLWQLLMTYQIAQSTAKLVPELSLPLETTHLILVHSNALAIRFRLDEKQFDVDGAYNIRYEIIKKRIDKAFIKDTNERLTQPNKIAIVYSQDKDADEYKRYLTYMISEGLLEEGIEEVELEELQGVVGLKALRVKVATKADANFIEDLEKMMQTV